MSLLFFSNQTAFFMHFYLPFHFFKLPFDFVCRPKAAFCKAKVHWNEGVVSKETVVLRRWGSSIQKFGFINGVDNVNWPP